MSERTMQRLLALVERHLGAAWVEVVVDWLRDQNTVDAIEARLLASDFAGVIREVEAAALKFAAEVHEVYVVSGRKTATWLDRKVPGAVRFDATNERAIARARANQLELVSGLTQETREVTSRIIADGVQRAANPRETARLIRDSIGLTPTQDQHVRNFRRALEDQDWSNALRRELRDKRSDVLLSRLRREKKALTPKQIDRMVARYREKYLATRADTIARTEALRSVHQGNEDALSQALDRGDVEAEQLVREWHAGGGPRTRDSHRAMDEQKRKMGEAFTSGDGYALRYPGDPAAPASDTVNCRCAVSTVYAEQAAA